MLIFILSIILILLVIFRTKLNYLVDLVHYKFYYGRCDCRKCFFVSRQREINGSIYYYSFLRVQDSLTWLLYRKWLFLLQIPYHAKNIQNWFKYPYGTKYKVYDYSLTALGFSMKQDKLCNYSILTVNWVHEGWVNCFCDDGKTRTIPLPCIIGFSTLHYLNKRKPKEESQ